MSLLLFHSQTENQTYITALLQSKETRRLAMSHKCEKGKGRERASTDMTDQEKRGKGRQTKNNTHQQIYTTDQEGERAETKENTYQQIYVLCGHLHQRQGGVPLRALLLL